MKTQWYLVGDWERKIDLPNFSSFLQRIELKEYLLQGGWPVPGSWELRFVQEERVLNLESRFDELESACCSDIACDQVEKRFFCLPLPQKLALEVLDRL